uniref:Phosphatidylinositol transfer protein n=1 Tax=Thelazia callipaeda TaxID=103827 RepID=A0A0N5CRN4_THECL
LYNNYRIIKEYRIPLPVTVTEYRRGQLYAVAQAAKNETGGGEGVEVLKQEKFNGYEVNEGEKMCGVYTHKIYRIKSKVPASARKILPDGAFVLHEKCWNAYPYCKTIITNPDFMGEKFYIKLESMHKSDRGDDENDISDSTNVRTFKSKKTGRGPLKKDWIETAQPIMCCYKLRELFCWIDGWYDLSMEDIEKIEEATKEILQKQIAEEGKRGVSDDENKTITRLVDKMHLEFKIYDSNFYATKNFFIKRLIIILSYSNLISNFHKINITL